MRTPLKTAVVAVAVTALGALSACGGSSGTADASGTSGTKRVVYVPGLTGNPFYSSVSCGAQAEAKKQNVSFSTQGAATFDVSLQTQIVNSLVASKPDAIMISITDPKAMIAPLTQAKAAGIKIIGVDGDLSDTSVMTTDIQADNIKGGMLAGENLAKAIGGKGDVIAIDNATGSTISQARVQGFKQAIAKYPGITFRGVQYSANAIDKAASIASAAASTNADLRGVYGVETNNTQGAITGVREAGKSSTVKIVGYDTSDPIVQALHDGDLVGTVVQFPYGEGQMGIDSAVKAIDGQSVPRDQDVPFVFATPKNIDTADVQKYVYKTSCPS